MHLRKDKNALHPAKLNKSNSLKSELKKSSYTTPTIEMVLLEIITQGGITAMSENTNGAGALS